MIVFDDIPINEEEYSKIEEQKRFKSLLPELLKRVQVYTDLEFEFDWLFQKDFFCKDKNYQLKLKNHNSKKLDHD